MKTAQKVLLAQIIALLSARPGMYEQEIAFAVNQHVDRIDPLLELTGKFEKRSDGWHILPQFAKYDRKRAQRMVDEFVSAWTDANDKHSVVQEVAKMVPVNAALFAVQIYEALLQVSRQEADAFEDMLRTYAV